MMLRRAGRLLARLRPTPPPPPVRPPRAWADELADAGTNAGAWVRERMARDALYVNVDAAVIERLRREHAPLADRTIESAARVLRHEFDLLGSGPFAPHDPDRQPHPDGYRPIDWYLDPVAGLRFPRGVPIADWDLYRMRPGRADVKLPWELARCQHWAVLGQAYRLTGDDRFALEIANELRDFMDANPIGTAVNWACTMDVALRAANWAIGLELVRSCGSLTPAFWHDAYRALFDHGVFIDSHLENHYEVTSNHFLSNVVGLFFLAAVFDDLPRGREWNAQCREWLEREMQVQVLPDGADYESSVPYQRLVTELFLGASRLADYRGSPLSRPFRDRLLAMFEFLSAIQRPDGLMPQVGDADDGRLHVLSGYGRWPPQDARHLLGPAAGMFERRDWAERSGEWGVWEAAWWGFLQPDVASPGSRRDDGMRHFPHAGLTVMRRGGDYLLVTNGIVGTGGFGNHKHNDQLGFEYHVDATPIFVDPGSYVYTSDPDARNLFRSTGYHNTVSVDREEQNELRPDWLFRMFEHARPEHVEVRDTDGVWTYRGRHHGYARLAEPVVHERTFTLSTSDRTLTIADLLLGHGDHRLRWHFHFAPGVVVSLSPGRVDIRARDLSLAMSVPPPFEPALTSGWYSPSYGVRTPCVCLDLETAQQIDGRLEYRFHVAPVRPGDQRA
jgi:heparinase II/III-like protein